MHSNTVLRSLSRHFTHNSRHLSSMAGTQSSRILQSGGTHDHACPTRPPSGTSTKQSFSTTKNKASSTDPIFQMGASNLRFGPGATAEVGHDLVESFQVRKVLVVTDPTVRTVVPGFSTLLRSLEDSGVEYKIFDQVHVEPTDQSFQMAIDYFRSQSDFYEAVVAIGGGSVMDTAKAANLYACHPTDNFYTYVNPPLGQGQAVPRPLSKPMIAIPTTSGTGSETTGVAIFDDTATMSKTGIAHAYLKPALGIVDPLNTATQPTNVTISTGLDVLCHAVESYTALPSRKRSPRPASPLLRPAYQGSNPVADVWSLFALDTVARVLPQIVKYTTSHPREGSAPNDVADFEQMRLDLMLASSAAGMGFGNAGVHLCHGMSYPVSAQVKDAHASSGYYHGLPHIPSDYALIPHGLSVMVNAPSVFEFTEASSPERHTRCAKILWEARTQGKSSDDGPLLSLADELRLFCQRVGVQTGLAQFGYTESDIPSLVQGTLPQHRVTKLSPRPVDEDSLTRLFGAALIDSTDVV